MAICSLSLISLSLFKRDLVVQKWWKKECENYRLVKMLLTLRWGLCVCVCVSAAATSFCRGDCWSHTSISNQGLWREEGWWGPMRARCSRNSLDWLLLSLWPTHRLNAWMPFPLPVVLESFLSWAMGPKTRASCPSIKHICLNFLEICKEDQKLKAAPHFFNFVDWISYCLDSLTCWHIMIMFVWHMMDANTKQNNSCIMNLHFFICSLKKNQ